MKQAAPSAPEPKNILQRLHAVMEEVDYIQKERKSGMRYSIVSHDAVTAKVRPALVKHGVIYYPVAMARSQNGNRTEIDMTVRFANIDDQSDYIDVVAAGYGVDDQDKGPGKAISYGVKYCLLKALGMESGDDPDEVQDERANHKPDAAPANGSASGKRTAAPPAPADDKQQEARAAFVALKKAIQTAPHMQALDSLMKTPETNRKLALIKEQSATGYEQLMELVATRERAMAEAA